MKRIAICMDGTWQRLTDPRTTNIGLLAQAVRYRDDQGHPQVVHYGRGVGALSEIVMREGGMLVGGLTGAGLEDGILEAYLFLAFNFEVGDQIYIFGYSRGAFSARSLGGLIRKCGILERRDANRAREAFELYRDKDAPFDGTRARAFRDAHSLAVTEGGVDGPDRPRCDIAYMGVFDTVGQRGIPSPIPFAGKFNRRFRFHDLSLGGHVRAARHALALDERRVLFPDTPWDNLDARNRACGADPLSEDAPFQQRWFPGTHGDVGGGVDSALPEGTLAWIAEGARKAGLALDEAQHPPLATLLAAPITPHEGWLPPLGRRRIVPDRAVARALTPEILASKLHDTTVARLATTARARRRYLPAPLRGLRRVVEAMLAQQAAPEPVPASTAPAPGAAGNGDAASRALA